MTSIFVRNFFISDLLILSSKILYNFVPKPKYLHSFWTTKNFRTATFRWVLLTSDAKKILLNTHKNKATGLLLASEATILKSESNASLSKVALSKVWNGWDTNSTLFWHISYTALILSLVSGSYFKFSILISTTTPEFFHCNVVWRKVNSTKLLYIYNIIKVDKELKIGNFKKMRN